MNGCTQAGIVERLKGGGTVLGRYSTRGGCDLIGDITENLFLHVRAIRKVTISQDNRASRSIVDHMRIIEALESRNTEQAESLVRQHTLDLAAHVEKHCDFLD